MKKLILSAVAAFAVMFGAHSAMADDHGMKAQVAEPAPEITAVDIHGNDFKLSDHKGKIVVLEWTNHQCPFVIKHYDSGNMQKLQQEARDMGGVEWVSIVSSAEGKQGFVTAEEAKAINTEAGVNVTTQILDPSGTIGKTYGAKTTPHMYVINAEGVLAYAGAIDDNSSPRADVIPESKNFVMAALADLKAGNEVQVASSAPYGCSVKY